MPAGGLTRASIKCSSDAIRVRAAILGILVVSCVGISCRGAQESAADRVNLYHLAELQLGDVELPLAGDTRAVDPKLFEASFYWKDRKCTSTLVGPRVLLTAAHCLLKGRRIAIHVEGRTVHADCTPAPEYDQHKNRSPDYALCLMEEEITETRYFETVNTDPELLKVGQEVLLTGFGCTEPGGGGDTSGDTYRIGEADISALPTGSENRLTARGSAVLCVGDSGGPGFLQQGKDGSPRIQISVNAGSDGPSMRSFMASLSTEYARTFMREWSSRNRVEICGVHRRASPKCQMYVPL